MTTVPCVSKLGACQMAMRSAMETYDGVSTMRQLAIYHRGAMHLWGRQERVVIVFSESHWTTGGKLKPPSQITANAREVTNKKPVITIKNNKMVKRKTARVDAYYVNIKLGSLEVMALIDTGPMVTSLSVEVFDHCTDLKKILQPCILSHVVGVGDQSIDVLLEIHLPLDLGLVSSEPQRIVITECGGGLFPFVLGMDFLDAYGLQINMIQRQLCYTRKIWKVCCNSIAGILY